MTETVENPADVPAENVAPGLRNATLEDLYRLLQDEHARKVDMVLSPGKIRAEGGLIYVTGAEADITPDGVTDIDGVYRPTDVFDDGVATRLGVPRRYLRRLRQDNLALYDQNINGWLHHEAEGRNFMIRAFRPGGDGIGVARALVSDRFRRIEDFDTLVAILAGLKEAGVRPVVSTNRTDRRMIVKVAAPEVQTLAPLLLKDYRSPFRDGEIRRAGGEGGWTLEAARRAATAEGQGYAPGEEPIIFAGFTFKNSEVGFGGYSIAPEITVQPCMNGLRITKRSLREVHIGARNGEGELQANNEVQAKVLEVISAQAKQAVTEFLNVEFMETEIRRLEERAGLRVPDPQGTIEKIAAKLSFSEDTAKGIMEHFLLGSQPTAGGLLQAVTSYSQTVENADLADTLDAKAMEVFELAVTAAA